MWSLQQKELQKCHTHVETRRQKVFSAKGHVDVGGLNRRKNRKRSPLPTDVLVQFVLEINEALVCRLSESHIAQHSCNSMGSNARCLQSRMPFFGFPIVSPKFRGKSNQQQSHKTLCEESSFQIWNSQPCSKNSREWTSWKVTSGWMSSCCGFPSAGCTILYLGAWILQHKVKVCVAELH